MDIGYMAQGYDRLLCLVSATDTPRASGVGNRHTSLKRRDIPSHPGPAIGNKWTSRCPSSRDPFVPLHDRGLGQHQGPQPDHSSPVTCMCWTFAAELFAKYERACATCEIVVDINCADLFRVVRGSLKYYKRIGALGVRGRALMSVRST
jgi:hypothetical protein